MLIAYGGLDAHTKPSSEIARQFIYAVFLANVGRVNAMLRDNPKLVQERYARVDTALHHATRNGDLEIVEQLVGAGADVNGTTDNGHFPLYCAAGSWACRNDAVSGRKWRGFTSETRGGQNSH